MVKPGQNNQNTKTPLNIGGQSIGMSELVVLTASLWALNALAIDMMLPALGTLSDDLGALRDNDRQLMIIVFIISNGIAQLFFGPLVDRFGRRTILLACLLGYTIASLLTVLVSGFNLMLMARAMQGVTTAGTRVASIAVVRDRAAGRDMAQILSLVVTIFMAAPIIAPSLGQAILWFGSWRWIFVALMIYGLFLGVWVFIRVTETMTPEKRVPLNVKEVVGNYKIFFCHRTSMGYTIIGALIFANLFAFISASEQIFIETFELGNMFALAFAFIALPLGGASIINNRIVQRYGMRRITHIAIAGFVVIAFVHYGIFLIGLETFWTFEIATAATFFCIGFMAPNCTSIAMEPMGHIAGSAGAANGFASTVISGVLGGVIARFYDGTSLALVIGTVVTSILAFLFLWIIEKGVLFEPAANRIR